MATLKVLMIIDEPATISGITRIIQDFVLDYPYLEEEYNFELNQVSTKEEAIILIKENTPDIILLDNKFSGLREDSVMSFVKTNRYDIAILIVTSYTTLDTAIKATREGAFDYIPMPFTPQELRNSMEQITKHLFLKRMITTLREEGKMIRHKFLSVLSYELKDPIFSIESDLKMMFDRANGNTIEAYKDIIARSMVRLQNLRSITMDFLDLTKGEYKKTSSQADSVNVKEIAQMTIDSIKPYSIQKDIDVYLKAPDDLFVKAFPQDIELIFNNIMSNAVKYNKDGGRVDCIIKTEGDSIIATISDTGTGIEEAQLVDILNDTKEIVLARN